MEHFRTSRTSPKPSRLDAGYVELDNTYSNSYASGLGQHDISATATDTQEPISQIDSDREALHHNSEEDIPLVHAVKKSPKLVGWCLALTLPIIGWGYSAVVVGSIVSVDSFLIDYGERHDGKHIMPATWLSLWLGLPLGGSALGALLGGWLGDRVGRRFSLMAGSILSVIAIALIFFSFLPEAQDSKRALFTAGLTWQGLSGGIIKTTCLTYVSENSPTALRASAMALFPAFTLIGQLLGSIVVFVISDIPGQRGYLGAFGSQWIPLLAPLIISIFMPESPSHLIRIGKHDAALTTIRRLFTPGTDAYEALKKLEATIEEEKKVSEGITYFHAFRGNDRRRTLIVILASVLPTFFGLDLLSNVSYFLQTIGLKSSTALLLQICGTVCGILSTAGGTWILTRVGRRSLITVTIPIVGFLWGGMGISGFWRSETVGYISAGFMISVVVTCGLGCLPASYTIMGETSALQLRAKTQGLGQIGSEASGIIMSTILPYIFNPDAGNLGGKTGFVYFGLCMIALSLTWFCVPEMKDRSAFEIDHMFAEKIPTRNFKRYAMPGDISDVASPLGVDGGT